MSAVVVPSSEEFPHLSPTERRRVGVLRRRLESLRRQAVTRADTGQAHHIAHEIASVEWAVEFIRISTMTPPVHGYVTDDNPEPEL